MAALDWLNRLFQGSTKTRGLSGRGGATVALDEASSFYNDRLIRHRTYDDIVMDPSRVWSTGDGHDNNGLGRHVRDVLGRGGRFSDVLVVLSREDVDRAHQSGHGLVDDVHTAVVRNLEEASSRDDAHPLFTDNTVPRVLVAIDGSSEVGETVFGLRGGEFLTGILPNLYAGPHADAYPLVAVHAHIPGSWEGYREVGRLFSDQLLFTMGSHWLDNFQADALEEPALYQLERSRDGKIFHTINPELQDRYRVTSTDQNGTHVLTIATFGGRAVAYLVLAALDAPTGRSGGVVAQPTARASSPPMRARTLVPEAHTEQIFTLQERGALLQKVHFSAFMLGYDVYISEDGNLTTERTGHLAVLEVRKKAVRLRALGAGLEVGGQTLAVGQAVRLEGTCQFSLGGHDFTYRSLSHITADGWPYVGEVLRPATSNYLLWGKDYDIGRSRDCRILLPDEPENANIVWKPDVADGASIHSRMGEIPKSRFYTDSIMVASEHAAIRLHGEAPEVACTARHCFVYVRRGQTVEALYPSKSTDGPHQMVLQPGDDIMVGNSVFHVSFDPGRDVVQPTAAPRVTEQGLTETSEHQKSATSERGALSVDDVMASPSSVSEAVSIMDAPASSEPPSPAPRASHAITGADGLDEPDGVSETLDSEVPALAATSWTLDSWSSSVDSAGDGHGDVVVVDANRAMFELGRAGQLVQVGWVVRGDATVGNHLGCEVVIPENRLVEGQTFRPTDLATLSVSGRNVTVEVHRPTEVEASEAGLAAGLEIIRRDDKGLEDFRVGLSLGADPSLPDPRSRILKIGLDEPLAAALFTFGLPMGTARDLQLGVLSLRTAFDGKMLTIDGYLESYRRSSGFVPFFLRRGAGGRFLTAPEDGRPFRLMPGDRLLVGHVLYEFRCEPVG